MDDCTVASPSNCCLLEKPFSTLSIKLDWRLQILPIKLVWSRHHRFYEANPAGKGTTLADYAQLIKGAPNVLKGAL